MNQITNDIEFRKALQNLDAAQQRVVAARFVEHVLSLTDDGRLSQAISVAANAGASADDIDSALKSARAATNDSSTRCGAECNWKDQAGYFVARAAVAALTPQQPSSASPAWQAAMSSRMAQTSMLIDSESTEQETHAENEWQYETLSNYLKT